MVYASSAAVYGALDGVAAEDSPVAPLSAYGADKLGSELHARAGFEVHGVPSVGFRFFNVYGPRQDPHSPYSGVISIVRGGAGGGARDHGARGRRQTRDFVYVADIVVVPSMAGMAHAARTPGRAGAERLHGAGDVGPGWRTRWARCCSAAPVTARSGPGRGHRRSVGQPERARAVLGVLARTTLASGRERSRWRTACTMRARPA